MSFAHIRVVLVGLAAVVLGAGIAAITTTGESPREGVEVNLVAHSASAARDAGTAKSTFSVTTELPALGALGAFGIEGEADLDFDREAVRMTARASSAMADLAAFEMEMIIHDGVVYLRIPELSGLTGMPADWFSMDARAFGDDLDFLFDNPTGSDPSATLDYLHGASDDVEVVGAEPIRGVPTTHYRATVDLRAALDQAPPGQRQALQEAMDELLAMGGNIEFPLEVWIDADGLPRRIAYTIELELPEFGQAMTVDFRIDLFDYGADVDIRPPSGQVTDLTDEMLRELSIS